MIMYLDIAKPNPRGTRRPGARQQHSAQHHRTGSGAGRAVRTAPDRRVETWHGFTAMTASWLTLTKVREYKELAKK